MRAPSARASAWRQGGAPCASSALPARLVAHQQLHRRLGARRVGVGAAGLEREEAALAEGRVEGQVDGVEQLPAAAEVALQGGQAPAPAQLGRGAVEDPHVGVAEAVDRLQAVADGEQAIATEQREDLGLQRVDVLELVHHHGVEAAGPAPAQVVAGEQEVAHAELEVVEVEAGGRALEARVAVRERDQQRVEDGERRDRAGVHEGLAPGGQRVAVALAGGRGRARRRRCGAGAAGRARRAPPARPPRRPLCAAARASRAASTDLHDAAPARSAAACAAAAAVAVAAAATATGFDGGQARLRLPRRAQLGVGARTPSRARGRGRRRRRRRARRRDRPARARRAARRRRRRPAGAPPRARRARLRRGRGRRRARGHAAAGSRSRGWSTPPRPPRPAPNPVARPRACAPAHAA